MTDNTQPEALRLAELLTADEWPGNMTLVSYARECVAELRRQHARIAELEAQLEAIGAGGVSGPLMGRASIAASAGSEPVAWRYVDARGHFRYVGYKPSRDMAAEYPLLKPIRLYLHPSPPEGMVGWWMPIETAPKDGTRILLHPAVEVHDAWSKGYWSEQQECWIVGGSASGLMHTYWHALPPSPPTTSAGSGKGE